MEINSTMITKILNGVHSNLYSRKINIDIANKIRQIRKNGTSYSKLSIMFNVSKTTIINICKNKVYI